MKTTFDLTNWMSENREIVISEFAKLKTHQFYNGCTLKHFMTEVLEMMKNNRVNSEKMAAQKLPFFLGNVFFENSQIGGRDFRTEALVKKYAGTAYMALV